MTTERIVKAEPMDLALTPAQLKELITTVLPFTDKSGWIPEFNAILIESADGVVTATATDRYTAGKVRVEVANAGTFVAPIARDHCAELLRLFKAPRGRVEPKLVHLRVEGQNLTVSQPGTVPAYSVTVPLVEAGKGFPSVTGLIQKTLRQAPPPDAPTTIGFTPALLSKFSHLGEGVTFRTFAPNKPVLVMAHNFVGMAQPLRPASTETVIEKESGLWLTTPEPDEAVA